MKALWILLLLTGCQAIGEGLQAGGATASNDVYQAQTGLTDEGISAKTDQQCMSDCLKKGSLYGYCKKECSY